MKKKIKKYKKVKSTNDIALKLIKKNISQPTLIITEKQTNGRGRIGKNGYLIRAIFLFHYSLNLIKKKLLLNNLLFSMLFDQKSDFKDCFEKSQN